MNAEQPIRSPNGADVYTAGPLDAYAWPGGYPIAYYPVDEHGSTVGDVVCPTCANAELSDPENTMPDGTAGYIAQIIEEAHHDERCDNCYQVIAYQNWCDFCQDSVDVDADHPHVCKPLKWSFVASYTKSAPWPHAERYATREQARENQRRYKRMGYWTSAISPIVPPILPESWS